ncbi:bifunctional transcriptional activator/DNA repair enzyme AdaA [Desmospora activa]|uniref:AraC family transcriptional regulator of adaptative response / methylphosphotriester-DNA alkyltransferase methyltransferase n=1 Tax=Desmospora activa DSM 45169 TaxID=1121389 RepID=A0A2T4Z7D3_9BACL|nr:bifunctional transcriptional activator/DNA repair enzyme AdaA [Desmospora activa]PTM57789.1 AraC family transcriptional regulator of adaptative response / methylphosphotriester-DNA alkyltransferase methyltransferase [Desmospora activa DSM 45169]
MATENQQSQRNVQNEPNLDENQDAVNEEYWQAIIQNDSAFDRTFFYAVETTGIFCRPSCKSRVPNRENVRIFKHAQQALAEHFRPCKRCRPDEIQLPDEEWINQIVKWIDCHYHETLTLQNLAERFHVSPYHLHRTFKRIKGRTVAEYVQQIRISTAMKHLSSSNHSVMDIAVSVGIPNAAHFSTLFQKKLGLTPTEYRRRMKEKERSYHEGEGSIKNA